MEFIYTESRKLQQAWVDFAKTFEPNFYVTLTDPTEPHLATMKEKLGRLCGRVDRAILGKKFARHLPEQRTDGIFFIEHVGSNIHAHGLLRVPKMSLDEFEALTKKQWHRVCRDGKYDLQEVYDCAGVASYCTKEITRYGFNPDQIAFTRDFMKEISN
ncbi:hypothetical protein EXN61_14310 [Agrobacterium tumefaciens]|uniref:Inovirus Gp2 family protein n=1 Tax=Agrobacterium tumefaciens TaxID=358 RepID=A0A546Y057_AGRTU|nr:hypothetical protein [Agrobacterium tumefaciens]TRB06346.1 hypothetical protein EXN61_14310 [Agrobacterium tumefaciens]